MQSHKTHLKDFSKTPSAWGDKSYWSKIPINILDTIQMHPIYSFQEVHFFRKL
jgi:hypothetical protein